MDEVPENIRKKKAGEGMFVVRYIHVYTVPKEQCVFFTIEPRNIACLPPSP